MVAKLTNVLLTCVVAKVPAFAACAVVGEWRQWALRCELKLVSRKKRTQSKLYFDSYTCGMRCRSRKDIKRLHSLFVFRYYKPLNFWQMTFSFFLFTLTKVILFFFFFKYLYHTNQGRLDFFLIFVSHQ